MHRAKRADHGPIFDCNVAAERGSVSENDVVADATIVGDVGVGHDQGVAAHAGEAAAFYRAAIDGDELANFVVVADLQAGGFSRVSQVLRRHTEGGEGENAIVDPELSGAFDGDMRNKVAAFAEFYIWADHAVRADLARRMNLGSGSTIAVG